MFARPTGILGLPCVVHSCEPKSGPKGSINDDHCLRVLYGHGEVDQYFYSIPTHPFLYTFSVFFSFSSLWINFFAARLLISLCSSFMTVNFTNWQIFLIIYLYIYRLLPRCWHPLFCLKGTVSRDFLPLFVLLKRLYPAPYE